MWSHIFIWCGCGDPKWDCLFSEQVPCASHYSKVCWISFKCSSFLNKSRFIWMRTTKPSYWNQLREGHITTYFPDVGSSVDAAYDIPAKGVAYLFTGKVKGTLQCFAQPVSSWHGWISSWRRQRYAQITAFCNLSVAVHARSSPILAASVLCWCFSSCFQNACCFFSGHKYWVVQQLKTRGTAGNISEFGVPSSVRRVDAAVHVAEYGKTMFFVGQFYYR